MAKRIIVTDMISFKLKGFMNLILFALQQSLGYKGIKLKSGDKIKAGHPGSLC